MQAACSHWLIQYINIYIYLSALALLQPALFVLSQTDLGPRAAAQYLTGFRSADFSQTLLSLKLKCLHSFSKFSQVSAASSNNQSALVHALLFFLLCFHQDNATQQTQSRGIVYAVGLIWFNLCTLFHEILRCLLGQAPAYAAFLLHFCSLKSQLIELFFIKLRQTLADYSCLPWLRVLIINTGLYSLCDWWSNCTWMHFPPRFTLFWPQVLSWWRICSTLQHLCSWRELQKLIEPCVARPNKVLICEILVVSWLQLTDFPCCVFLSIIRKLRRDSFPVFKTLIRS